MLKRKPRDPKGRSSSRLSAKTVSKSLDNLSTKELAENVIENACDWLKTPNPNLGGRNPGDLIGTEEEIKVRTILFAVDLGFFS